MPGKLLKLLNLFLFQDKEDKENIRGVRDGPTSGSPLLAFTPTSVMRKNAAERKDSDPRPGVPELKITGQESENGERGAAPPSPGRALKVVVVIFINLGGPYSALRAKNWHFMFNLVV